MSHSQLLTCCWLYLLVQPLVIAEQYRIFWEKAVVVSYDTEYAYENMTTFKFNRSHIVLNSTMVIHKDFPSDAMVTAKTYEFLHNEYRPFAIELTQTVCNFLELQWKMFLYKDISSSGDSKPFPPYCPLRADTYTVRNYIPEAKFYPVALPFKRFMLELTYFLADRVLLHEQFYMTMDRDVVIREQYG